MQRLWGFEVSPASTPTASAAAAGVKYGLAADAAAASPRPRSLLTERLSGSGRAEGGTDRGRRKWSRKSGRHGQINKQREDEEPFAVSGDEGDQGYEVEDGIDIPYHNIRRGLRLYYRYQQVVSRQLQDAWDRGALKDHEHRVY